MTDALFVGIDVGAAGALALVTGAGDLAEIADMPVLRDGRKNRASVNAPLQADILASWNARAAFVEYVGARPGEGAVGAFAFGRSRGVVDGVCGATAAFIPPAAWKRAVGIPPGRDRAKDAARAEAIHRCPNHAGLFARVKDDGRSEAALIAAADLKREVQR